MSYMSQNSLPHILDPSPRSYDTTGSVFSPHLAASYRLALTMVSSMVLLIRVFMSDVKAPMASDRLFPLLDRNF